MSEKFEINSELSCYEHYENFKKTIHEVRTKFQELFGVDALYKIPLYIDNSTSGSGYTPLTGVILRKYVTIKLKIDDFSDTEKIIYQFAHEMCHFTYRCIIGINKKQANIYEESICSAMSLCFLNGKCRNFESWCKHVRNLKHEGYRKGYDVALACDFNPEKLRNKILSELNDYRKIALDN